MRTSALVFFALPTLLLACEPSQDLGGNNATGSGGDSSTASSTSGNPGAGGGSTGTTSSGGTGGADATTATSGTGGANVMLACPPAVKHGTLATVPFTFTPFGEAADLRFGQAHHYVLEGPWVDYATLDGQGATGSITLDLNVGYRALQILPGNVSIPAAWQSGNNFTAVHVSATDETVLALKTNQNSHTYGHAPPGLAVDGTDVYWSLRVPARIVEAPLGGGSEWAIADYDAASGIAPLALAVDATHVYWTTAKPTLSMTFESGKNNNHLYRAPRHSPGAAPELLASSLDAMDAIVLEGNNVHVGFAAGASSSGAAAGTVSKTGGELNIWGLDVTSFREGRMVVLDGYVFYTEHNNNTPCGGRLLRYSLAEIAQSHFFRHGEVLVDGMRFPSNMIIHGGKLYFTTEADSGAEKGAGALFSFVPPATPTCLTCGDVYTAGANDAVCAASDQKFMSLLGCGLQAGCGQVCTLPASGLLSASCKACIQQHCPTEASVCSSDAGG